MTPPPGPGCEAGGASPHWARAPGVTGSAAPGDGPAAGAPRLLEPGAVTGPAGEGGARLPPSPGDKEGLGCRRMFSGAEAEAWGF